MTNSVKTDTIQSLITIAYYWMGEQNPQSTLSIIKLLYKLDLTTVQGKKVDDLYHDFKTFFKTYDEKLFQEIKIPAQYETDEQKILWISGITIMNLFSSGNFELAYTQLMDMSLNWNELYIYVVNSLKKQPFMQEVANWLVTHFFMACDLLEKNDIELMGYRIEKIKEEE